VFDDDLDEDDRSAPAWFDGFRADGVLTEILTELRSGKEATVFVCRAGPSAGGGLLAAKVHRDRGHRTFRNDAGYLNGRSFGKHRENRAVRTKTRFGREVQAAAWVGAEHESLRLAFHAGVDVPEPVAASPGALVMRFVGDEDGAAPQLREARLHRTLAREVFDRLLDDVERLLAAHLVHGDLSAYNVLWWEERPWIIDFPQAVDARTNRNAHELLDRDVANVCRWAAGYGIDRNAEGLSSSLWHRYLTGRL
jgi:RIO kinase 1